MGSIRNFKKFVVGSTELDGEAGNSDLTTAKRLMVVSVRSKYWPDLRAGVTFSTSLLTLFFDYGIFVDVNLIQCANHLPDVKSVITLFQMYAPWYIFLLHKLHYKVISTLLASITLKL